jgi:hypothetical protein
MGSGHLGAWRAPRMHLRRRHREGHGQGMRHLGMLVHANLWVSRRILAAACHESAARRSRLVMTRRSGSRPVFFPGGTIAANDSPVATRHCWPRNVHVDGQTGVGSPVPAGWGAERPGCGGRGSLRRRPPHKSVSAKTIRGRSGSARLTGVTRSAILWHGPGGAVLWTWERDGASLVFSLHPAVGGVCRFLCR